MKEVNDLKLLLGRASVLLFFALLMVFGLFIFTARYMSNASTWVHYPTNQHLYAEGKLLSCGTIYDRRGSVLCQVEGGELKFHADREVRTAVMHATGDLYDNVMTGARVAFRDQLSGWNIINGVYSFRKQGKAGRDLTLNLDADLCAVAYGELGGRKGAVGVYNYQTGEILCMVSSPSFDPENPPDVEANPEKYQGVYINRLLSAVYTPGSVFKLVTAAAAIECLDNIEHAVYHCEGGLQVGGDEVTCHTVHGPVNLEKALACSCNVAFAQITSELGAGTLQKYADVAGFNTSLEVDGIKTAVGRFDVSDAVGADLAWSGIGQYTNTANPLNIMAYMGAIANDGVCITPRIVKDKGIFPLKNLSAVGKKRMLSSETARKLGGMMRNNTISEYGEDNFRGLELCAKSGTAEVGGDEKPHAWFAGFLDREDYPLAFVVVIENGGSGASVAGPVAAKVLQAAVQ
jgi:peptidoglycan glycosyltransferase